MISITQKAGRGWDGSKMKGLLTVVFTVATLASPPVWASTELRGAVMLAGLDEEANARDAPGAFDLLTKGLQSAVDRAADAEPFAVDETWLTNSGDPPKTVADELLPLLPFD